MQGVGRAVATRNHPNFVAKLTKFR